MLEVFDTIPEEKERNIYTAVLYGDYEKINDVNNFKFNGTMPIMDLNDENRKSYMIISILISCSQNMRLTVARIVFQYSIDLLEHNLDEIEKTEKGKSEMIKKKRFYSFTLGFSERK